MYTLDWQNGKPVWVPVTKEELRNRRMIAVNKKLRKILMQKIIRYNRHLGSKMNLPTEWREGNNYVAILLEDGTLLDAYSGPEGVRVYENMILIDG